MKIGFGEDLEVFFFLNLSANFFTNNRIIINETFRCHLTTSYNTKN